MTNLLARLAFFFSGVAGLTFEVVWLRYLGLSMGTTTVAIATTTGVYMGGLALGSHLGGRLADRTRHLLALYGGLELAIAALGLAVPFLTVHIASVDAWVLSDLASGSGRALVRLIVAICVLILPTTLMGMTLPVLARGVTDSLGEVGRQVGLLYGINLFGAMVGAALAGFWWIPSLGLAHTNILAVSLDASIGLVAIAAGFKITRAAAPAVRELQSVALLRPGARLLVGVLFATGFAAMALQVLWTRALGTALGPSTYAFATIVCAYLLGLALGGVIAAQVADRIVRVRMALAVTLIATTVAVLLGIAWIDDLPALLHHVVLNPELSMGGLVRTEFALAALSLVPATIGMGVLFPLTASAVVGSETRLGSAIGFAYAANTAGNIIGAIAAPFVLLPLVGVEWGMRTAALIYIVAALLLVWRSEPSTSVRTRVGLATIALAVLAVGLLAPSWNIGRWTAGLYRISYARGFFENGVYEPSDIVFHRDGLAATVTVEEDSGVRWIKVDGKIDGSSAGDMPTQVLSGALPMVLHADPKRVAVIGCGSGVTVGTVLAASPDSVTLVEIEPAMIEGSHLFGEVNGRYWEDPRARIVIDDGRNFMTRTRERFDVIISEPSNPWMSGAASLFTREFFHIAASRLAPQGLFVQWLQIYELAPARIEAILQTFRAEFPHVLVFTPERESTDLLLVGSLDALHFDPATYARRYETLRGPLTAINMPGPEAVAALLIVDDARLAAAPPVELNTDDNALIEFGAPQDLLTFAEADADLPVLQPSRAERMALIDRVFPAAADTEARAVAMTRAYLGLGMLAEARDEATAQIAGGASTSKGELDKLLILAALLTEDDAVPVADAGTARVDEDYARVTRLIAEDDFDKALEVFGKIAGVRQRGALYELVHGYLLYREGDNDDAARRFTSAASKLSNGPFAASLAYYQARNSYADGRYQDAVSSMQQYVELCSPSLSRCRSRE
ncbi:MAG: fused MFS/spermidine synthase [Myxococcota bacterium]